MDAGGTVENDVDHAHANDLGDPRAGVVEHGQQQMVALRRPAFSGLPQHRNHLLPREISQHGPFEALHRHPQCPLDHMQRGYVTSAGELQERTQRGQSQVAAANPVMPLLLQIIEERQDQFRLDVDQLQAGRHLAQLMAGELQEQHYGVAVTGYRARTDRPLRDQILGEELLHQRGERRRIECGGITHGAPPIAT